MSFRVQVRVQFGVCDRIRIRGLRLGYRLRSGIGFEYIKLRLGLEVRVRFKTGVRDKGFE